MVKPAITSVDQLKGKTLATPQLGNTQDVALRAFLKTKGFKTDIQGGGDVEHQAPGQLPDRRRPSSRAPSTGPGCPSRTWPSWSQAGGKVLVDEKDLWPGGQWVTTNVLVRTAFLKAHPATVKRFLTGLVDAIAYIKANPADAQAAANAQLQVAHRQEAAGRRSSRPRSAT